MIYKSKIILLAFFAVQFIGCADAEEKAQGKLETKVLTIQTSAGANVEIKAELARTVSEKQKGLMFRKALPDGEGMLFVYDKDEVMSFWMKNTTLPLSIAYISSGGRILEIYDMEPLSLHPVRSVRSVRYALEVPLGWYEKNNITINDTVNIEL